MAKDIKVEEENWKVEEAMRNLIEYQKLMKDEELKNKAIKKLKEREKEIKQAIKEND